MVATRAVRRSSYGLRAGKSIGVDIDMLVDADDAVFDQIAIIRGWKGGPSRERKPEREKANSKPAAIGGRVEY